MALINFQLQAATESALLDLLAANALGAWSEGRWTNAPGVLKSEIGQAVLHSTGVMLAGRYVFCGIDDAVFGVQRTSDLVAALTAAGHLYTGPELRAVFGVANWDPMAGAPTEPLARAKWLRIDGPHGFKAECKRRILAVYPIERQMSTLADIYGAQEHADMVEFIDAHIAAENAATDAVEAATTAQAVAAVTPAWPQ